MTIPTYNDVLSAAQRIEGVAHHTPVMTSRRINDSLGIRLYAKAEHLQRAGAFKFRGAYNALVQFTPEQRARGVIAYSSGNHAQAIALAAKILDIKATIIMPKDAPALKRTATEGYGAKIVEYDRYTEDREAIGADIAAREHSTLIPPFNHPDVIAGQGTAALELITDVPKLDLIVTPLGGGGLTGGTAIVASHYGIPVIGVEPAAGNDVQQSLATGAIVSIDTPQTIADGAQTQHTGDIAFAVLQEHHVRVATATDTQLVEAMRIFASTMKQIIEPTGCLPLAAIRSGDVASVLGHSLEGLNVGVICSGGNVDLPRFARLILEG